MVFHGWLSRLLQRDYSWPRVGSQCIQDSPIETRTQVLQRRSQLAEFHSLGHGGCLAEALECLSDVVLFALRTTGGCFAGMPMHPVEHQLTKAMAHPCPPRRITLHARAP